jgi:VWFA-related protein
MMRVSIVLAAVLAVTLPAVAQEPEAAPPLVFSVGLDVVAVDASVVDAEGRPIPGLGPEDFRIEVDGRPRRILTVEYLDRDLEPRASEANRPTHFSSNEDVPRGRLVLLLVDRGSIGRGGGREVFKAAERFLSTLAPADRVGLAFVPGPGKLLEFTADRDLVRQGLRGVVGTADRGGFQVPLAEAVSYIKNRDRLRWQQWVQLQCDFRSQSQAEACNQEMEAEAGQVYLAYRERSLSTLRALASVFEGLKGIEGPKTVVFISEGLGAESTAEVRELAGAAAVAQATLFVVLVDTSGADASFRALSEQATSEDRDRDTSGLYDLAGLARGVVLKVVSAPDAAFQRIARELMGYYMLGFEPEGEDRDGRNHSVKVEVSRPKATVRARGLLNIPASAPTTEAVLAAALRSPLVERGLPIRATAYALRDGASGKVRLLIAARVGRASRPVSVGFAVSGAGGKVVASRAYQGLAGGDDDGVDFTGEAVVDPATYNLRLAAVDAGGRRGSVEHTVKAALVSAGGLEISDLVLAPSSAGAAVRPAVDLELAGGGLSALVELAGRDADRLAAATIALELADSASGPSILRAPVAGGAADKDGTRVGRIEIAAGLLPPGDYAARAEVSVDGKPVAVVTRPFRIVPPKAGSAIAGAPLAGLLVEVPPFDRAELLRPDALGPFLDRLGASARPEPSGLAAAVGEGRGGRPEAMLDHLGGGGKDDARVAFLRGVSYYARGNVPSALTHLQAALRLDSELFPAAVYMGACYAAEGKDLDAIGAWQTALIGDVSSPVLYALLADALVRAKEQEQALSILSEGLASFPEDVGLRRRIGMAYAMAGRAEEALPLLTAWVDAHPEDQGALFATMALLFEGFSRETAGAAALEERQRLTRYAKAYVDGEGPNREVIERWLRYLESRTGG